MFAQLPRSVYGLFTQPVVVLNQAALGRAPWAQVARDAAGFINEMGNRSAMAQGLVGPHNRPNPITTASNLGETNARVYLLSQTGPTGAPVLVGLLKMGYKQLFHYDAKGRIRELPNQLCVLDFYVHDDYQRGGYGKALFMAMLQNEAASPQHLAYDVSKSARACYNIRRPHTDLSN